MGINLAIGELGNPNFSRRVPSVSPTTRDTMNAVSLEQETSAPCQVGPGASVAPRRSGALTNPCRTRRLTEGFETS